MLQLAVPVEIFDLKGLCEVLSQEMRSAGLKRLPVAHHGLDGVSNVGAGKFFRI